MRKSYLLDLNKMDNFYKHPYNYYVKPFKIISNLYFVGNADVGAYLIDTGDGLILIDTAYPQTVYLLFQSIWEAGFDPKDIKYILHSHGHFDHFGGTIPLVKLSGAKTFLGAEDIKMFATNPELALFCDSFYAYAELFQPDYAMNDGDVITLGNTSIHIMSTPGHSKGVCSFFFDVTENGKKYTVGMFGGSGLNTLCREHFRRAGLNESVMFEMRALFEDSLQKLINMKVDIMLGNHTFQNDTVGKYSKMLKNLSDPNPFIDPKEWLLFIRKVMTGYKEMLEANE
ncbi:MBL fold metallo-hydrolase [Petroclostridium sp. X23]|uniref:MBL fold metallo-hydrolase n=1 Tax=Petroclostridium sp. X23 TaxID=3045146 RepID=UPI0024AD39C5|nr:MBL fold metallo-hydrolase [Petroclostridium sp. X23]WHH57078.1 MBL fold metallo-hydrolase [Petroclostridium sp. X23]